jgi:hypothetical protein
MHNDGPQNPWQKYDDMALKMLGEWGKWVEEAGHAATVNQSPEAGELSMVESISSFVSRFVNEQIDRRIRAVELQAAQYGANQARREVCKYLRESGSPATAMAISARCKWPEGN